MPDDGPRLSLLQQREIEARIVGPLVQAVRAELGEEKTVALVRRVIADLARQIKLDATFDFIGVSSYGNRPSPTQELKSGWDSTGEVKLTKDVDQSMQDKNVIVVEDILDTVFSRFCIGK